jgi:signal transduction histidine kinase
MVSQTIRAQRHPPNQPEEASHQRARTRGAASRGRILVVDNDPEVLRAIQALLQEESYLVESASTHREAQKKLQKQPFDLVLTDLQLDSANEQEPLAEFYLLPHKTIAIILTGYASMESAIQAIRQGAYDYLVKPLDVEELKLTVARALERQRLQRELAERVHELEAANLKIEQFNQELRHQVDEATQALQRKVEELAQAKQTLEEAHQQQSLFLAMVAHELMNPVTSIIAYAQYAGRPNQKPERVAGSTASIVSQGERLKRLIRDLQDVSRLATGQFELKRAPCDLIVLTKEAVEHFRSRHTNHQFVFHPPAEDTFPGSYDRDRLLQAITNLLDNAVKYSDPQTTITIQLWAEGGDEHLSISDEGIGISPEQRALLFQPFARLEPARTRKIKGTGLGLYITKGIIEAHNGRLLIETGAGNGTGTTFTLSFPRPNEAPAAAPPLQTQA